MRLVDDHRVSLRCVRRSKGTPQCRPSTRRRPSSWCTELREADANKMAALVESQAAKEKQHGRRAAKLKQKEEEMQVLENEVRRNPPVYLPLPFFALPVRGGPARG